MQQDAQQGVGGSPKPSLSNGRARTVTGKNTASTSVVKPSSHITKSKATAKAKSRSNSKVPREFGCRKRARAHGALVLPDGEETGPLLLSAATATVAAPAVPPEVQAYRAAVAVRQLKHLRGGLTQVSASAGSRDPRFSSLCGDLNVASCSKAYAFVEEQQQQLMKQLQHVVKTGRVPAEGSASKGRKASAAEREQVAKQLQRLQSQQQQRERRAAEAALKASLSRAERQQIAATGKRPHYVSRKKLRELLREQQQQATSNKKKIKQEIRQRKKAIAKERKRNSVPQRRHRSGDEAE